MSEAQETLNPEKKLAEYSKVAGRIATLKAQEAEGIALFKQKMAIQLAPWNEKEKAIRKTLKTYFTKNKRTLFEKIKSLVYTVATVGFRRTPPKLNIPKDQSVLIELIKQKMNDEFVKRYITTTEKLNIEVLEKAGDNILKNLGIKWKSKDQFFIDLNKNPASKRCGGSPRR